MKKSTDRLIKVELLVRITKGVYANARVSLGAYPLESIAINIRRGEYSYLSLESALSHIGLSPRSLPTHDHVYRQVRKM
ncbi:hypothetical protein [Xenorhabdus doucetiae]|uniref:hypothetical protein n=1 Tax=Xenorhabdus doucetiae TaxID=351671 RepID=UPI001E4D5448|nr:hypothetical protein [Xenorhabdus doucetiae]